MGQGAARGEDAPKPGTVHEGGGRLGASFPFRGSCQQSFRPGYSSPPCTAGEGQGRLKEGEDRGRRTGGGGGVGGSRHCLGGPSTTSKQQASTDMLGPGPRQHLLPPGARDSWPRKQEASRTRGVRGLRSRRLRRARGIRGLRSRKPRKIRRIRGSCRHTDRIATRPWNFAEHSPEACVRKASHDVDRPARCLCRPRNPLPAAISGQG